MDVYDIPRADWLLHGSCVEVFKVTPPLFCPYFNKWGRRSNLLNEGFDHNPFGSHGELLSGAPVIQDAAGFFVGFVTDHAWEACRFSFDGRRLLRVRVPAGQSIIVGHEGELSWRRYNSRIMERLQWPVVTEPPAHWLAVEYTTWVEQRRINPGRAATKVISHHFVMNYLERLKQFSMPAGRLTIGYGWMHEEGSRWQADPQRFPDFRGTLEAIQAAGFTPGVSLTPGFSSLEAGAVEDAETRREPWLDQFSDMVRWLADAGVGAITLDIPGQDRRVMLQQYRTLYTTVKALAPEMAVEIHQADLQFSRFTDSVRVSDIVCTSDYSWEEWARALQEVWYKCAPGRPINLGPIGGSDPGIDAASFMGHLELQRMAYGHPGVSMLGDHWSHHIAEALSEFLAQPRPAARIVSDFYDRRSM